MKNLIVLLSFVIGANQAQALPIHHIARFQDIEALFQNNQDQYDFRGIVKLSNCSGALVRFENSKDSDFGLVLSNGHCVSMPGMMNPNQFAYHKPAVRSFKFLDQDGSLKRGSVSSTEVLYATMTGTDISLYLLDTTYAEIHEKFGIDALVIDSVHPTTGQEIDILSGYWQKGYSCKIDQFVFELLEAGYRSKDSIRYTQDGCHTIHGTSGSPILSRATHRIIGINNTGNDDGKKCTMDNPCEVGQDGSIFYQKGLSYGQQTFQIYTCLNHAGKFDLKTPGCQLFQGAQAI